MTAQFDFNQSVAYDAERKRRFHRNARAQLLVLAEALGLAPDQYDLRSNPGGIAVSGEIVKRHPEVHRWRHEELYHHGCCGFVV